MFSSGAILHCWPAGAHAAALGLNGLTIAGSGRPKIAVEIAYGAAFIELTGPSTPERSAETAILHGFALSELRAILRDLCADDDIEQIVLLFDSPGGSVNGLRETLGVVRRVAAVKPIHAHVYEMAAGGALWLAAACDRVTARQGALLGFLSSLLMLEVDPDGARPGDLHAVEVEGDVADGLHEQIRADLKRWRGMDDAAVEQVMTHDVLRPWPAADLGLIDAIERLPMRSDDDEGTDVEEPELIEAA